MMNEGLKFALKLGVGIAAGLATAGATDRAIETFNDMACNSSQAAGNGRDPARVGSHPKAALDIAAGITAGSAASNVTGLLIDNSETIAKAVSTVIAELSKEV